MKGAAGSSFFVNAVSALFSSERHQTDIVRRPDGHRAATGRHRDVHRSNFEPPSGHRAIAVRFMLSFQFNHSNRTDVNGLSDGPINRPVAVQLDFFSEPRTGTGQGLKYELLPFKLSCHRTIAVQSPDECVKISSSSLLFVTEVLHSSIYR